MAFLVRLAETSLLTAAGGEEPVAEGGRQAAHLLRHQYQKTGRE